MKNFVCSNQNHKDPLYERARFSLRQLVVMYRWCIKMRSTGRLSNAHYLRSLSHLEEDPTNILELASQRGVAAYLHPAVHWQTAGSHEEGQH